MVREVYIFQPCEKDIQICSGIMLTLMSVCHVPYVLKLQACSGFILLLRAYGKCIYRYQTEENCYDAVNKFNIYPYQIPSWLVDFMPNSGGHLIGNIQQANMNFRFFSLGNFWSIN